MGGPFFRQIRVGYGPLETLRPGKQPFLNFPRPVGNGVLNALAGVHLDVLQMGEHAGADILEFLARNAAACRTQTGKVVLAEGHIAFATAGSMETEPVCLNDHLEKCIVPANAKIPSMVLIVICDRVEFRSEVLVSLFQKRHQPVRCHADGNLIRRGRADRWCLCCVGQGADGGEKQGKEKYGYTFNHDTHYLDSTKLGYLGEQLNSASNTGLGKILQCSKTY